MRIFLKTLRGDKLELHVEPSFTVAQVKEQIAREHGHDPSLQKLISSGKILEDGKELSAYNLKEDDTLVIMVNKPKPAAPVAQPRPTPPPQPATSQPQPSSLPSSSSEQAGSLVTGEAYEEAVARIVDMGFERSLVQQAMRAAYNNPERAIQYLLGGLPEETRPHPAPSGSSSLSEANPLAFLLENPMFLQLRTMIQQNPSILPSLLQQLQQTNPQLLALISQHQDAFMSLINDPLPESAAPQIDPNLIAGLPRPRNVIQLTPEEAEAVQRLSDLGFVPREALEAYLCCDKNEAMAANLLFENYVPLALQEQEAAVSASLAESSSAAGSSIAQGSSLADPQVPPPREDENPQQHPDDPNDPEDPESHPE